MFCIGDEDRRGGARERGMTFFNFKSILVFFPPYIEESGRNRAKGAFSVNGFCQ